MDGSAFVSEIGLESRYLLIREAWKKRKFWVLLYQFENLLWLNLYLHHSLTTRQYHNDKETLIACLYVYPYDVGLWSGHHIIPTGKDKFIKAIDQMMTASKADNLVQTDDEFGKNVKSGAIADAQMRADL
jgi:hypothetical protein